MNNQGKSIVLLFQWQFLVGIALLIVASQPGTHIHGAGVKEEFSYVVGSPNDPAHWGDISPDWAQCKAGTMQDPIDIPTPSVTTVPSIGQLTKAYKPATSVITKDQKVKLTEVAWQTGEAGHIQLDGRINYTLMNIHWHVPSEHQIDGKRHELERHMVHLTTDSSVSSKVVVISQLYEFGAPDPLLTELKEEIVHVNQTVANITVDPTIAGNNGPEFFRFMGSLTTPPCSEHITWFVDNTIATVTPEQVEALKKAIGDSGEGNARPVQPLNDRSILRGPFLPA